MSRIKTILLYVMAVTYMYVGFDHLSNPEFYIRIIPPDLPLPEILNVVSGLAEIVLGVFLYSSLEPDLSRPGGSSPFWLPSSPPMSTWPRPMSVRVAQAREPG